VPCLILPDDSSDATFTVATSASSMGIAASLLQDQEGDLPSVSYLARMLRIAQRGNSYSAYHLETLLVCQAVKHGSCYVEGCSI
jgi:hypothetical protein